MSTDRDAVWERRLGDLEAVVMDRVWQHTDKVMVRDIHDELCTERRIAYTTVMSTMDNLHRKNWLTRERVGKAYLYWPTMTREQRTAQLMSDALAAGGDSKLVLTHFLQHLAPDDSEQLSEVLRAAFGKDRS